MLRGGGGVLNLQMQQKSNRYSIDEGRYQPGSLNKVVPGTSLTVGVTLDGTINLDSQTLDVSRNPTAIARDNSLISLNPYNSQSKSKLDKHPGLKAESNLANGGVGVSYSNVVLGGPHNPNDPGRFALPKSTYQ